MASLKINEIKRTEYVLTLTEDEAARLRAILGRCVGAETGTSYIWCALKPVHELSRKYYDCFSGTIRME